MNAKQPGPLIPLELTPDQVWALLWSLNDDHQRLTGQVGRWREYAAEPGSSKVWSDSAGLGERRLGDIDAIVAALPEMYREVWATERAKSAEQVPA